MDALLKLWATKPPARLPTKIVKSVVVFLSMPGLRGAKYTRGEGIAHEIAAITELPIGTVKSHITRGVAKLRRWLQPTSVDRGNV